MFFDNYFVLSLRPTIKRIRSQASADVLCDICFPCCCPEITIQYIEHGSVFIPLCSAVDQRASIHVAGNEPDELEIIEANHHLWEICLPLNKS